MKNETINIEALESSGWKDATGGWGGSQGSSYCYEKNGVRIIQAENMEFWFNTKDNTQQFIFMHDLKIFDV